MKLYDYITKHTSPNQSLPFEAETITIHWWGEPKHHRSGQIGGVVSWLCNPAAQASAHFVASGVSKQFAQLIDLAHKAWHSANAVGNRSSVGIEMHPWDSSTPAAQREADLDLAAYIVALIWHWRPRTKGKALKGHRDWHNTACPGTYYARLAEIHKRATAIYPRVDPANPGHVLGSTPAPKPPTNGDDEMQPLITFGGSARLKQGIWTILELDGPKTLSLNTGPCQLDVRVNVRVANLGPGGQVQVRPVTTSFKSGTETTITKKHPIFIEALQNPGMTFDSGTFLMDVPQGSGGRSNRVRLMAASFESDADLTYDVVMKRWDK